MTAFIYSLAVRGVSASTQNRALSAVLFSFEVVLGRRLAWISDIVRSQRPARLPVVLSREAVSSLLSRLHCPAFNNNVSYSPRALQLGFRFQF